MNLMDWLAWIFNSGGSILVASWLLERVPAYTAIVKAETKKYIFWAVSFGLSGSAFAIVTYVPQSVLLAIAPYFGFAFGTFGAIFLGTLFHQVDVKDQIARNVETK